MLERSQIDATPLPGVTMLSAHYVEHRFDKHAHETYCFGVTLHGVQAFFCRGAHHASTPGHVIAFNPEDPHDGHSGDARAFAYRMLYVDFSALELRQRVLFKEPLLADAQLFARTVEAIQAIRPQESLRAQTLLAEAIRSIFNRSSEAAPVRCNSRAARIRDYLEAHLEGMSPGMSWRALRVARAFT